MNPIILHISTCSNILCLVYQVEALLTRFQRAREAAWLATRHAPQQCPILFAPCTMYLFSSLRALRCACQAVDKKRADRRPLRCFPKPTLFAVCNHQTFADRFQASLAADISVRCTSKTCPASHPAIAACIVESMVSPPSSLNSA
jgi:hypothetical protein